MKKILLTTLLIFFSISSYSQKKDIGELDGLYYRPQKRSNVDTQINVNTTITVKNNHFTASPELFYTNRIKRFYRFEYVTPSYWHFYDYYYHPFWYWDFAYYPYSWRYNYWHYPSRHFYSWSWRYHSPYYVWTRPNYSYYYWGSLGYHRSSNVISGTYHSGHRRSMSTAISPQRNNVTPPSNIRRSGQTNVTPSINVTRPAGTTSNTNRTINEPNRRVGETPTYTRPRNVTTRPVYNDTRVREGENINRRVPERNVTTPPASTRPAVSRPATPQTRTTPPPRSSSGSAGASSSRSGSSGTSSSSGGRR